MLLSHIMETQGFVFEDLLELAVTGDTIEIYRGPFDSYGPDPRGALIARGKEIFLNGSGAPLHRGKWKHFCAYKNGAMVELDDKLLFRGQVMFDGGDIQDWGANQNHFFVENGDCVFLDGKKPFWRGDCDNWELHPFEPWIATNENGQIFLNEPHQRTLLYDKDFADWGMCQAGLIIEEDGYLFFGGRKIYCNESDTWTACLHGAIMEAREGAILLVVVKTDR